MHYIATGLTMVHMGKHVENCPAGRRGSACLGHSTIMAALPRTWQPHVEGGVDRVALVKASRK